VLKSYHFNGGMISVRTSQCHRSWGCRECSRIF